MSTHEFMSTRRAREIRRGIRIARADKEAMRSISQRYWETATFHLNGTVTGSKFWHAAVIVFPILVGFLAPPIFTIRGRAWRREIRTVR